MSTSQPSAQPPDHDAAPEQAPTPVEAEAPVFRAVDVVHPSTVRRAPRYGRFGFLGFLLGALAALILALVGVSDFSTRDVFLVLLLALGTAGIFAGLLFALAADRRSVRRRG